MDEIEYGFRFTDDLQGFDQFINRLEELEKKFDKLKGEDPFDKIGEGAKELEGEVEDLVKDVSKLEQENKKLTDTNNEAAGSFLESAKNTKIFGVSINDIKGRIDGYKTSLLASRDAARAATVGTSGLTKATKLFRLALISTGIGAIVVAFGALVTFLSSTQRGMDAVTSVTRPLSALFQRTIGIVQDLGGSLFDAFSNPLETLKSFATGVVNFLINPIEGARKIITGLFDTAENAGEFVKESLAAGSEIDKLNKKIEADENKAIVRREELNLIAKKGQQTAQDQLKTDAEREKAAKEAIAAIEERGQLEVDLLADRIKLKELENSLNDTSREDNKELQQLIAQGIRAEASATQQTTRLKNNLNTVVQQAAAAEQKAAADRQKAQEEELKRVEALNKAFDDQLKTFQDQVNEVISTNSSDADRAEQFRQKALADLLTAEQQLIAVAEAAGRPTGVITEGFEILSDQIEAQYRQTIERLNAVDIDPLEIQAPALLEGDTDLPELNLGKQIGEAEGEAFVLTFRDQIQKFISEDLGLSDEDVQQLSGAINQVFSSIQAGVLANTASQIEAQDELIDSLKERVDATESALDRELQLKIAGYANDYDALKDNLADQNALVADAEEEKTELKKKQLEQQLIFDEIAQASALVTAIAQIIESTSGIPVVGLVLAGLAIASMITLFTQYKQQVNSLEDGLNPHMEQTRKSDGKGFKITGRSHKEGGELFRQRGAIWEAERDEILMGTKASRKHAEFLFGLNQGEYDHLGPLDKLLNNPNLFNSLSDARPGPSVVTVLNNNRLTDDQLKEAVRAGSQEVIDAINKTTGAVNSKHSITALPNGDLLEMIYNEDGTVAVKRTIERGANNVEKKLDQILKKMS